MTTPRGQARPRGRRSGIDGDPILSAPAVVYLWLALGLVTQGLAVPAARAQTGVRTEVRAVARTQAPPEEPAAPAAPGRLVTVFQDSASAASRDSLMAEIRRYSSLIEGLRDSLSGDVRGLRISPEDRERLERSVGDISKVIERIGHELSRLELQVRDNTISLVDEAGEGIVITIPENLDERLSEGFNALSEIILSELPDTVRFDRQENLTWLGRRPPPPKQDVRVVQGNLVKVWDDLLVPFGEDVRGEVVVVFGNAEVRGRVDGNVVVVFGNLQLSESAEVTGQVVAIGGRLDQHENAAVGDVFVLDPFGSRRGFAPLSIMGDGLRGFVVCQSLFLLMLFVALAAAFLAPAHRFRAVVDTLGRAPGASFGVGALAAVGVHLVVLVLIGVLVLTVIGIPLALLVWLALLVVGVVATAVAAAAVGERVCRNREGGCPSRWLAVLVGMLALHAVSFFASLLGAIAGASLAVSLLSVLGATIKALAYMFGVGALAISRFGSTPRTTAEASAHLGDNISAA